MYGRARALGERLGATPEVSQALWGLWTFHALKAELSAALAMAGEMLQLAERVPHPGVAMRGQWAMAITHTHRGNFRLALEHSERALALCGADGAGDNLFGDALNPGVAIRCFASWCLWFMGHADRALVRIQEAVALARRFSEPHGLAHALFFAAVLHQLRRERPMAQRCADEVMVLAAEHGLVLYGAAARIVRGWALIGRGDDDGAAAEIREGLAAWQATGAELMKPHFLALLAEAYAAASQHDQALRILNEALALADATGERMYEAEISRLREQCLRHHRPSC